MTSIHNLLIRATQSLVGIFFVFVISSFFGLLLLLPLGVLYHFTNLFTALFGINGIVAMLFSLPLTGAMFYYGFKIDGLYNTIFETGIKLIEIAKKQIMAFEKLINKHPVDDSTVAASK